MAKIVLGIGCAHTPQIHTAADKWEIRGKRETEDGVPLFYQGEQMKYAEVLEKRAHMNFAAQMDMDIRRERLDKCFTALDSLSEIFSAAKPDVTIIFGNDQAEMFLDDIKPAFTIMGSPEFENMPRTDEQKGRLPPGIEISDSGHLPEEGRTVFPGHPALAEYLASYAINNGFDVAYSHRQYHPDEKHSQLGGIPHAYGFICKQIFRDNITPHVPIDTNTFFPPNQPLAPRCYALGKLVGEAIRAWDEDVRVAIVATGGLSHFVVEEDFDNDIMQALIRNDFDHLLSYHEGYFQVGASEIKSWIAAAAAMQGSELKGNILAYYALYRTPAGTGSSAPFVYWQ